MRTQTLVIRNNIGSLVALFRLHVVGLKLIILQSDTDGISQRSCIPSGEAEFVLLVIFDLNSPKIVVSVTIFLFPLLSFVVKMITMIILCSCDNWGISICSGRSRLKVHIMLFCCLMIQLSCKYFVVFWTTMWLSLECVTKLDSSQTEACSCAREVN